MTREHSIFYCTIWEQNARHHTKSWIGKNTKKILFLRKGKNNRISVWYNRKELDKHLELTNEKVCSNIDFFKQAKKIFMSYWKKLFPLLSGNKKLTSIAEIKEYYYDVINWFFPLYAMFDIPEFENVSKSIKDEALKLRELTEKYSDFEDKLYLEFMTKNYPQYTSIMYVLTPNELFSLEKKPLSAKKISLIKKRLKGCFIWKDKLHLIKEFEKIKKRDYLKFSEVLIGENTEISGQVAFAGKASGRVRIVKTKDQLLEAQDEEILVTEMTSPDYVPAMKKSGGIITDEGGLTCHAAIVARELKIPCIVGTKVATKILKDGDFVRLDTNSGSVKIIK